MLIKIVSIILFLITIVFGSLTYQQHRQYKKLDIQRFNPNPDGSVTVELFGPGVRKVKKAKTARNVFGVIAAVSTALGVGGLGFCVIRKE